MSRPDLPFNLAKLMGMGRPKPSVLILDDPAPVEPPTAEQLATRREFIAKHVDAGDVVLPPLHFHEDDIFADLLEGGDQ